MLSNISTKLAVNLATIAQARKLDLTPIGGSLIDTLSQSVKHAFATPSVSSPDDLSFWLENAANGNSADVNGFKTHIASSHDTLMDNYGAELPQLVGQHVSFAQTVVHKKVLETEEKVLAAFGNREIKEAEDFFDTLFYKLPELFKSYFAEDEIFSPTNVVNSPDIINFDNSMGADFDVQTYLVVGDEDIDSMIREWINSVGVETVRSYLNLKSSSFEYSLVGPSALNFYLANFLFYRQLNIKQDLQTSLSATKLSSVSSVNRDYHRCQLVTHYNLIKAAIDNNVILTPNSQTKFTYLSEAKFTICIYDDVFSKMSEQDSVMEKIYGAIAAGVEPHALTVETIKTRGEEFYGVWKNTRSLYSTYLMSNREVALKSTLRLVFTEIMNMGDGEDKDSPMADENYRRETLELMDNYVTSLVPSDVDNLYLVSMKLVAGIAYRFSNAYFLLREMYEIMEQDEDVEPQEAAFAATLRYITDYLLDQVVIGKPAVV